MDDRKVTRVLVLLEYGDGDPDSGEVFDLTALATEISSKTTHDDASIRLDISTRKDYSQPHPWPIYTVVNWCASVDYHSSGDTGHLDDAINSALPDSFRTQDLKKKAERLNNKLTKLQNDIKVQRLMDAAAIRSQHPIARVKETPLIAVQSQPQEQAQAAGQ
jgi:hypothetical protein